VLGLGDGFGGAAFLFRFADFGIVFRRNSRGRRVLDRFLGRASQGRRASVSAWPDNEEVLTLTVGEEAGGATPRQHATDEG